MYTVKITYIIQSNFPKLNRERSQLLLQRGDLSSTRGVRLVSRRLELFEEKEESSPCLALCQSELVSQSLNSSQNRYRLKGKRVYLCLVRRRHPCSSEDSPSETRYSPDRTPDTYLCP